MGLVTIILGILAFCITASTIFVYFSLAVIFVEVRGKSKIAVQEMFKDYSPQKREARLNLHLLIMIAMAIISITALLVTPFIAAFSLIQGYGNMTWALVSLLSFIATLGYICVKFFELRAKKEPAITVIGIEEEFIEEINVKREFAKFIIFYLPQIAYLWYLFGVSLAGTR